MIMPPITPIAMPASRDLPGEAHARFRCRRVHCTRGEWASGDPRAVGRRQTTRRANRLNGVVNRGKSCQKTIKQTGKYTKTRTMRIIDWLTIAVHRYSSARTSLARLHSTRQVRVMYDPRLSSTLARSCLSVPNSQCTQPHTGIQPGFAIRVAGGHSFLVPCAIQPGKDAISSRREICRERHLPGFAVGESTVPEAGGQARTQGLMVIDKPLAALNRLRPPSTLPPL